MTRKASKMADFAQDEPLPSWFGRRGPQVRILLPRPILNSKMRTPVGENVGGNLDLIADWAADQPL